MVRQPPSTPPSMHPSESLEQSTSQHIELQPQSLARTGAAAMHCRSQIPKRSPQLLDLRLQRLQCRHSSQDPGSPPPPQAGLRPQSLVQILNM